MYDLAYSRLDNSEWMRNGDYVPSRWDAQADAVQVLFDAKTGSHPENMIGVMTMAGKRYVCCLTPVPRFLPH